MKELTMALLVWISSHTSFGYDGADVPQVIRVPQETLVRIRYQGKVPQGLDVDSVNLAGLYDPKDDKVYLLDSINVSTIEGRSVLVHELVHFLQYRHGLDKSVPCIRRLEPTAYAAQAKYLAEHGKVPTFNDMHVLLVGTCWPL